MLLLFTIPIWRTHEEADDLAQLVTGTAYAEAALLRQWVLARMQQFRVVEAIRLYQDGYVDIHQAATRARFPVAILLDEIGLAKGRPSISLTLAGRAWRLCGELLARGLRRKSVIQP